MLGSSLSLQSCDKLRGTRSPGLRVGFYTLSVGKERLGLGDFGQWNSEAVRVDLSQLITSLAAMERYVIQVLEIQPVTINF